MPNQRQFHGIQRRFFPFLPHLFFEHERRGTFFMGEPSQREKKNKKVQKRGRKGFRLGLFQPPATTTTHHRRKRNRPEKH